MEKYEGMSFEEAMKLLEEKIALLEKEDETDKDLTDVYEEAVNLKNYCAQLLSNEREEIRRIAKENNIPLSEIGLEENDMSIDELDQFDMLENEEDNNQDNEESDLDNK